MELPYLPKGRIILYVPENNEFMMAAKKAAQELSLDPEHPTGAVLVQNGEVLGRGANGSEYHQKHGCERKRRNIPTGQQYALCPGCDPVNHAERRVIASILQKGNKCPTDTDMYLWGHWWCCQWCWEAIIEAGIRNVYLLEGARERFETRR